MIAMEEINSLNQDSFTRLFGHIFENSDWVARAAWRQRPFASPEALHAAMLGVVRASDPAEQVAFLKAHPELAGRECQAGEMTQDSTVEQGSAGLDRLQAEEVRLMEDLNRQYGEKHGFPCVIAVRHYTKLGIFSEMKRRIGRDNATELTENFHQIGQITWYRLSALIERMGKETTKTSEIA